MIKSWSGYARWVSLALAPVLAAGLAGCPQQAGKSSFTLNFALAANVNPSAFDTIQVTIFQLSPAEEQAREVPASQKYEYDVFRTLTAATATFNGVNVSIEVRDVNGDTRNDLLFNFLGNPFQGASSLALRVVHEPWGRPGVPPPPFKVKLDAFRGQVLLATSGTSTIAAGTLFSGPNVNVPAIAVTCVQGQEAACQSRDAGIADGAVDAAPPPDEYTLTEARIEPPRVSQEQPGVTLSLKVKNGDAKDINFFREQFLVDNNPPETQGFTFTRAQVVQTLARNAEATFTYNIDLKSTDADGGVRLAAPGTHTVEIRIFAHEGQDASSPQLRFTLANAPRASFQIESPAAVNVGQMSGPSEVFPGDVAAYTVTVNNPGQAKLVSVEAAPAARLPDGADASHLVTFEKDPDAPFPVEIAGGGSQEYKFRASVRPEALPTGVRFEAVFTGKDGNDAQRQIPARTATKDVTIRGVANVVVLGTSSSRTTVSLGQGRSGAPTDPPVEITLSLENKGNDNALLESPVLKFLDPATEADITALTWIQQGTVTPGSIPPGGRKDLKFTYTLRTQEEGGRVGETVVEASVGFRSESRQTILRSATDHPPDPASDRRLRFSVVFTPGPTLLPPASELSPRFGAAVAGLGFVTFQGSTWPAIAIGAPDSAAGSGAVHFWQFIKSETSPDVTLRELNRAAGLTGARFGSSVAPAGNWDRTSLTDLSSEVVIGSPGSSSIRVHSILQSAPVAETLPLNACAGCDLGAAVAGNLFGLRDAATRPERRALIVGAPRALGDLGSVQIFWQRLPAEGITCTVDADCGREGRCVSGRCTIQHRQVDGDQLGERFGAAVAFADVDGDGDLDAIVGSPGYKRPTDPPCEEGQPCLRRGRVRVLRAPDFLRFAPWKDAQGNSVNYFEGETPGEQAGSALAGIGDVDGDGKDDFAVGAPQYATEAQPNVKIGRVYVVSGGTGRTLYTLEGRPWRVGSDDVGENFGASIASLFTRGAVVAPGTGASCTRDSDCPTGNLCLSSRCTPLVRRSDFNNDGRPDFAVGAPNASPGGRASAGAVYVFSGPPVGIGGKGKLLLRYDGNNVADRFGSAVGGAGDLNSDGFHDLIVGAPNAFDPQDATRTRRGLVNVLFGGPFQPFQAPPQLEVTQIQDDAVPPSPRLVSIGRTVRVRLHVRNAGDSAVTGINAQLLLRKGPMPGGNLIDTSPPLAPPFSAPLPQAIFTKVGTHPTTIEARQSVVLEFDVKIEPIATPDDDWVLSAKIDAAAGGITEVPEAVRRPWRVQRAPFLQVATVQTTEGNTDLGFTSINPGAPIELAADVVNAGTAVVACLDAALELRVGPDVQNSALLGTSPVMVAPTSVGGSVASARAVFRVETNGHLTPYNVEISGFAVVTGFDVNECPQLQTMTCAQVRSGALCPLVKNDLAAQTPVKIRASRTKIQVTRVTPGTQAAPVRFVQPGDANVPFETEVLGQNFTAGPSTILEQVRVGLRFSVASDRWVVAEVTGRTLEEGSPDTFQPTATVPSVISSGPVAVTGAVTAFDRDAGDLGVMVRGFSNPAAFPASKATIEVLGMGSQIAFLSEDPATGFGAAVAPVGDFNADQRADFAVSAPSAAKVFLFSGQTVAGNFNGGNPGTLQNPWEGTDAGALFGQSLASGYNLDAATGRTRLDLVIGAPGQNAADVRFLESLLDRNLLTGPASSGFGKAVAIADANRDGCPDVVVGAPDATDPVSNQQTGMVCVHFGTKNFDENSPACTPACASTCWTEGSAGDRFGAAVAAWSPIGDPNQNNAFLAVGAPGADAATAADSGRVYAYGVVPCTPETNCNGDTDCGANRQCVSGRCKPKRVEIAPLSPTANANFGAAMAANHRLSDTNLARIGLREKLFIGAPGASRVYELIGDPALGLLSLAAQGEGGGDLFGSVLATAGDVNGDGTPDIAIGAPAAVVGQGATGRVTVLSGLDNFVLFRFSRPGSTGVGKSLSGVGKVRAAGVEADDMVIGADGKVFLVAGLPRPPGASLRVDQVSAEAQSVAIGQANIPVLVRITNIGSDNAFGVVPTLLFNGATTGYTQTVIPAGGIDIPTGTQTTVTILVSVGADAPVAPTTLDARIEGRSGARDGPLVTRVGADIKDSWSVTDPPRITVNTLTAPSTVVFQGEAAIVLRATLQNTSPTQPDSATGVKVRLAFADTTSRALVPTCGPASLTPCNEDFTAPEGATLTPAQRRACARDRDCAVGDTCQGAGGACMEGETGCLCARTVNASYRVTQSPGPTGVTFTRRACTTAASCAAGDTCQGAGGACMEGEQNCRCANTRDASVTLTVAVSPTARLGEHEVAAEVEAPPMPATVTGPDTPGRPVWTVLPAGVLRVGQIAIDFKNPGSLSAGQQDVMVTVNVQNISSAAAGGLNLRSVTPEVFFHNRSDIPRPVLQGGPVELAPGETKQVPFKMTLPSEGTLLAGLGRVTVDAKATARDANHEVFDGHADTQAVFTLQRPPRPRVEGVQLQRFMYLQEPAVKLGVTFLNGTPGMCTADGQCEAGQTCVSGTCTPRYTATWSGIAPLVNQMPALCIVKAGPGCAAVVPLRARMSGTPAMCTDDAGCGGLKCVGGVCQAEIQGGDRVTLSYEFDVPSDVNLLGDARARLIFSGLDRNTGLGIPDLVNSDVTFTITRDDRAGLQLTGSPIAAPSDEMAVRFGESLAAAPLASGDPRRGLVVVGAPESAGGQGKVFLYGITQGEGGPAIGKLQTLEAVGPQAGDRFGASVAILRTPVPGVSDPLRWPARLIAVGAPGRDEQGLTDNGAIYLYDANTFAPVSTIIGSTSNLGLGGKIARGGDLDGDGNDDLIASLPSFGGGAGRVIVYSGASPFNRVITFKDGPAGSRFGTAVASGPDFPGTPSAAAELFVGAPGATPPITGLGQIFSYQATAGYPGGIMTSCNAAQIAASLSHGGRGSLFGSAIALVNIDDDACPDLVIGAPGEDQGRLPRAGVVYVARSGNGYFSSVKLRSAFQANAGFGSAIQSVGDWNGDGKAEIAISAPGATVGGPGSPLPASVPGVGVVHVYVLTPDDKNVSILRVEGKIADDESGPRDYGFGETLAAVDMNGDGTLDLVVGAPGNPGAATPSNGRIYVFQGGQRSGGQPRIDILSDALRTKVARGVPLPATSWPGLDLTLQVTNTGKSKVLNATPALELINATGVTVRCVCNPPCSSCTSATPTPLDIDPEGQVTWIYRLDVSAVAATRDIAIRGKLAWVDGLTGNPQPELVGVTVPEFMTIVRRGERLIAAGVRGTLPDTNAPLGYASAVASMDVNGDGFRDLFVTEPRQTGFGPVHVLSGRDPTVRLATIDAPTAAEEMANPTFGQSVIAQMVGGVPTVFVSQVDRDTMPGGVYAFRLDCSASTCAVLRPEGAVCSDGVGPCRTLLAAVPGENFGTSLAWLGQETIDGENRAWLAVSTATTANKVILVSVNAQGSMQEIKKTYELDPMPDGAVDPRHCGGPLSAREASACTSDSQCPSTCVNGRCVGQAQIAMFCVDLAPPTGSGKSGIRVLTPGTGAIADYVTKVDPAPREMGATLFGESVALLPNIDGSMDGLGEVLIGWPSFDASGGTPANVGRFELWAGATTKAHDVGSPYFVVDGTEESERTGFSVANVGDVDGDGVADFAVGMPGPGTVRVYSGLSTQMFPQILMNISAPSDAARTGGFGKRVTGVGDVNFDGFADVGVSAPEEIGMVDGNSVKGAFYIFLGGAP